MLHVSQDGLHGVQVAVHGVFQSGHWKFGQHGLLGRHSIIAAAAVAISSVCIDVCACVCMLLP